MVSLKEDMNKKIEELEVRLYKKSKELEETRLESEHLHIKLDEAYKKLKEHCPHIFHGPIQVDDSILH